MNTITWCPDASIIAGTTLRDQTQNENNNMALHVGGDKAQIINNRRRFSKEQGIDVAHWVLAKQTHSNHIHKVTKHDIGKGALHFEDAIEDCDALYTKESNILIGVFHADCVPILLYDPYTQIVCAIHSGWQGSVKEITRYTLQHLMEQEGVHPSHIQAYIGPSIALHSFEVGTDVLKQLEEMSFDTTPFIVHKNKEKAYVDNKGLNEKMLLDAGVLKEHIRINHNDTFMNNDALFSYRRDPNCGRHFTYIYRK